MYTSDHGSQTKSAKRIGDFARVANGGTWLHCGRSMVSRN